MIATAPPAATAGPIRGLAGIEEWNDAGPFDVILANAVIALDPRSFQLVAGAGGAARLRRAALAVQMPDNLDAPTHRADA